MQNRRDFLSGGLTALGGAAVAAGCATAEKTPPPPPKSGKIPYRMFWSWDHSTNWCENVSGEQNCGVANPYLKKPRFFEKDYKRCVDWCAAHGLHAVGIVGLLRDRHGGVDAARRLCDYAQKKGIRIYVIGGLYSYGGAYYQGNHKYSLDRFFKENPDCVGINRQGGKNWWYYEQDGGDKVEGQGCPSNPKLNAFVLESYDWLFKTIPELGGIQMEAGDCGVCQCDACKARRGVKAAKENMSLEDMAGIYPQVADVVRGRNPDAWIICETYHHFMDRACGIFDAKEPDAALRRLLAMPKETFWQWKCDEALEDETWLEKDRLPKNMRKFRHVMRSHAGTQWWGGRYAFDVDKIRRQCRLSYLSGLEAVSMFGEISPFHANSAFNYLALQYFSDAPLATMENFACDVMAPRLGGVACAEKWLAFANLDRTPEKIVPAVDEIALIAARVGDAEARRRWMYLGNRLSSFAWEWEMNGRQELPDYAHKSFATLAKRRKGQRRAVPDHED